MALKKQAEPASVPKNSNSSPEAVPQILLQEYNSLVSLYTHAENTLFSIFNFYVTILTTITGAVLIIFQLNKNEVSDPFLPALILLGFIVMIGLITQDALIHKNADLAHYALAQNSLKSYVLGKYPEVQGHIFYLWDLHTRVNPLKVKPTADEKIDRYLWWMLPIGMQQLFVTLMSSFALVAIVVVITLVYGRSQRSLAEIALTLVMVLALSFVTHCAYANIKFRQYVQRAAIAMNGKSQEWAGIP
jgi:hypothetical protein